MCDTTSFLDAALDSTLDTTLDSLRETTADGKDCASEGKETAVDGRETATDCRDAATDAKESCLDMTPLKEARQSIYCTPSKHLDKLGKRSISSLLHIDEYMDDMRKKQTGEIVALCSDISAATYKVIDSIKEVKPLDIVIMKELSGKKAKHHIHEDSEILLKICHAVKQYYTNRSVNNMFLDNVIERLLKHMVMSRTELRQSIDEIISRGSGWLSIHSNERGEILRMDKKVAYEAVVKNIKNC